MKSILKITNAVCFKLLIAVIALSWTSTAIFAQNPPATQTPEQFLRELYFRGDNSTAERDGLALASKPGASLETRAWYTGLAKSYDLLDGMQREAPQDAWTLAAQTFSLSDTEYAIALCERAIARDPKEDIFLLCTAGASWKSWSSPGGYDLVISFLDRHRQRFEASATGIATRANILTLIYRNRDRKRFSDETTALYDRALQLDCKNLVAVIGKFYDLLARRQFKDGIDFITPHLTAIDAQSFHKKYWDAIRDCEDLNKEERTRLLEADVRRLAERHELRDFYVQKAGFFLRDLSETRADAVMNFIIQKYPDSKSSEMAMVMLAGAKLGTFFTFEGLPTEIRHEVATKLMDFIKRPGRRSSTAEELAFYALNGYLALEKDADPRQMLAVAKAGSSKEAVTFAVALAERKLYLAELEQLASTRVEETVYQAKEKKLNLSDQVYAQYEFRSSWVTVARWYNALGLVYLQQGRLKEAETKLITAEKLADLTIPGTDYDNLLKRFPDILLHLGRLYTAKGDYAKAEQYLERALGAYFDYSTEHPAIAAYRDLYLRQHKVKTGLDKYMAVVYEKDAVRRKGLILNTRIANPQPIPAFKLASLDGKTYSSEELKGKFVVINFWGTWCGPCVKEMPDLQKFYDKYKNHPEVAVLTIDGRDTLENVKQFIALKKYTLPVLLEGDYFNESGVSLFPTTWFLDRDGKKVFQAMFSKSLVDEFSWRVEAMMENAGGANKSAVPARQ